MEGCKLASDEVMADPLWDDGCRLVPLHSQGLQAAVLIQPGSWRGVPGKVALRLGLEVTLAGC